MEPKILVISNEAFSDSGSNSRTMKNHLLRIPAQNLAQFYIHGSPDHTFCDNYFCVSDHDALNAFLCKKVKPAAPAAELSGSSPVKKSNGSGTVAVKPARSYRNLVLRNLVWQSMRWWKKDFEQFCRSFDPDIVLLQAGDAPFMYRIARRVAKHCHAGLMMYTSESYVLKKHMYSNTKDGDFWHFWLMRSLRRQYRKFMDKADYCFYIMEELEKACQEKYPHPGKSCSLYTVSELPPLPDKSDKPFSLLYCGNLGIGRDKPLAEIAEVLYAVDKTAVLDIYGKFTTQRAQERVCQYPNVRYHGFVDYSEIPELMSRASMLLHCDDNSRIQSLKYAFSTKIADCLASSRPFLVYATRGFPYVQYLEKYNCAHIAEGKEELQDILKKCMEDSQYRNQHRQNALLVASQNHNQYENHCRIIEAIKLRNLSSEG